ncbi:hypothetical protein D1614_09205 [Maribellus luteus]|uniref:CHAT domain-containing protein n=1 Tax=Maribellus luteus TaxID=2305463 RepID=A0A399SX76_9BACT|nr:hypothetical protein [Maribellus luteus]RIJ48700.1 hypothetical protein D1614_09205 [Maribellus luteus]
MSKLLHIIHPKDNSTDFLEEIHTYLSEKYEERIHVSRLHTREDHNYIFKQMRQMPTDTLYLFFGHGTSTCLSGAITRDFEYPQYISDEQLQVFEGKNVVLLSCRSDQYLQKYFKQCNLKSAIGFPNMITDDIETEYPEPESFEEKVTSEDILAYRKILVDVMKYSLDDYLKGNFSSSQLIDRMRLRINRKLINFYKENPNKGHLPFGMMLSELANDVSYFSN